MKRLIALQKGGVAALTRAMAVEFGRHIRINTVHPGAINTPSSSPYESVEENEAAHRECAKKIPVGFLGEALDIAQGILFLATDNAQYITGASLVIDGGYTAA